MTDPITSSTAPKLGPLTPYLVVKGAAAEPFCSEGNFCLVPCMGDNTCPVGMRCDDSVYGMVCLF